MSASLEDRLVDSLRQRAERQGPPPPCLADSVIRRGRRLRRRRRVMALVCAAALVGGGIVGVHAVRMDERSLPGPYATSIDPGTLAEGRPSAVPYMIGRTLVDDAGTFRLPWPGFEIRRVWQIDDGYLVEAVGEDSTSVLRVRTSGTDVLASRVRGLVVSSDGKMYAWEDISGEPPQVVVTDTYDGDATHFPRLPAGLAVAGFVPDERGFLFDLLVQPSGGGPISVWDFGTNDVHDTGLRGSVFDATSRNATVATIDGCFTALDDGWTLLWRDCALAPEKGAVSPRGEHVAAVSLDESVVVREASTGADVGSITLADATVGELRWEDDQHIVVALTPSGGEARLARCEAQSGECEWAGPPPPAVPEGEDGRLVVGHGTSK